MEEFAKRRSRVKAIWTILMIISVIATAVFGYLAVTDKEASYWDDESEPYYEVKFQYIIALIIIGHWDVFCLVFWIATLAGVKFHTYLHNGHYVSVYLGWSCAFLLIDNDVVDKHPGASFGTVVLEGQLYGELITVKVGAFLNNYSLRIGNKILH